MIRKVKFSNFYSFLGEQEISFLAKKKEGYDYLKSDSGDQITKIAGFVGKNASGKTNVMRFFSFLGYFICRSSKDETIINPDVAFKPFFNNEKSSNFYIEFQNDNQIFYYNCTVKKNVIQKEKLSVKKMTPYAKEAEVFSRKLNNDIELNKTFFDTFPQKFLSKVRPDISIVAFLKSNYDIDIINRTYDYFAGFKTNINEKGEINHMGHQLQALELYLKDEELKKEMEQFVCNFDLGLGGFEIIKEIKNGRISIDVKGIHETGKEKHKLDFDYESRGTRSLFFALGNILSALKSDNIIVIDEFESGFHPEALNKLISYFIDKNERGSAQLIFSSHALGFMNKLDMHQTYLVDKNEKCESFLYRLNEVENIRSDENFLAKYMTGSYGAFPKIRV